MREPSEIIADSVRVKRRMLTDEELLITIDREVSAASEALGAGRKALFCGNGGSAADAQHLAAEFSGRFLFDRPPLYAEALHVNTSYLTAVANDYSYADIYSRMLARSGGGRRALRAHDVGQLAEHPPGRYRSPVSWEWSSSA